MQMSRDRYIYVLKRGGKLLRKYVLLLLGMYMREKFTFTFTVAVYYVLSRIPIVC